MSASAILVATALAVLLVTALALLTGSLTLLAGLRTKREAAGPGGLMEALHLLDSQWAVERLVYRHHRIFGLLVVVAGTFCVWQLTRTELSALENGSSATSIVLWTLLVGQGFNLLVGLVILLRPSLLKPVEALSNRWHRLESASGEPPSRRLTAVLLIVVSLVILFGSATLLLQQISPLTG